MSNQDLIQAASEAIEIYGEDALEAYAEKQRLIDTLVKDYRDTTPGWTRGETKKIRRRLEGFTLDDLKLLCKGVNDESSRP